MPKKSGKWREARRCLICNDLNDKERRAGFMKDPSDPEKWIKCTCNDKGFNLRTGNVSS